MILPSGAQRIRVFVVDDHAVFREALRSLLEAEPDFHVIGEAADGIGALAPVMTLCPNVVLMDFAMPRGGGVDGIGRLCLAAPRSRVIVLTADISRTQIVEVLRAGARGVVQKDTATELLYRSIRGVHDGDIWISRETVSDLVGELTKRPDSDPSGSPGIRLTPREYQIMSLVASGATNREIARECRVREATVKHYLTRIFAKTGASGRVELATMACRLASREVA